MPFITIDRSSALYNDETLLLESLRYDFNVKMLRITSATKNCFWPVAKRRHAARAYSKITALRESLPQCARMFSPRLI